MKRILSTLIALYTCFGIQTLQADDNNVRRYVHNSDLQHRSTWQLLSKMKWKGDERVLDVGCRDGRNSAIIATMIPEGSVTAVSVRPDMLSWAKRQYHAMEYPNLRFVTQADLQLEDPESFDVATGFFAFHLVEEITPIFQGLNYYLKPGGKVIGVIPPPPSTNPEFAQALADVVSSDRWEAYFEAAPYLKVMSNAFYFKEVEKYRQALEEAGFQEIDVRFVDSMDPFVDEREFAMWFAATMPHVHFLPKRQCRAFSREVIQRYVELRPSAKSDEGVVYGAFGRIEMTARK